MKQLLLASLLSGSALAATPVKESRYEDSIVVITSFIQRPDYESPWKKAVVRSEPHLGTIISDNTVLVSAWAVGYAAHIEMNRIGDAAKDTMEVAFVDYSIGLAILKPSRADALRGLRALTLGKDLRIGERAELITSHEGERTLAVPVRLSDVDVESVVSSTYNVTHYHFEVPGKNTFGRSEPVVAGRELIGIAVSQADNVVNVLPTKMIRHFLSDHHDARYRGFPRLGISVAKLDSPVLRQWLGASIVAQGVMVTAVEAESPFFGKVERGDVLLRLGNHLISKSGYYQHPLWGPTHFTDHLADFFGGDRLRLTIVRKSKLETVEAVLKRHQHEHDYIPDYLFKPEPHLIFGGLIFQELSAGFLSAWGPAWPKTGPLELVYLARSQAERISEMEKAIFLNRVLADEFNQGYQDLKHTAVDKVNGRAVRSLADLREALRNPILQGGQAFAKIEFGPGRGEVILSYTELEAVHQRLAKGYNITSGDSFYRD